MDESKNPTSALIFNSTKLVTSNFTVVKNHNDGPRKTKFKPNLQNKFYLKNAKKNLM